MKIIVMMGPPGSGKGTYSDILADKYGYTHISMGDLLRARAEIDDDLGRAVKDMMDRNIIGAEHIVGVVLRDRLENEPEESTVILDGYPRTLEQAEALDELITEEGYDLEAAIALQVSDEIVMARILNRARNDIDRDERKILKRLFDYREQTVPAIERFEEQGCLKKVPGEGTIEEGVARVERALGLGGDNNASQCYLKRLFR